MAPLPVAVVMTSFDPGGTERQMIELIRRLDPSRWRIHLACFVGRGAWFHKAAEVAASVAEFPVTSFKNPSTFKHIWAFSRWCLDKRIAVVHTTEFYSNTFGLPGAALAGVPARIGSRRGLNPDKSRAQIALQRAAYACAHTIVANSRAAAECLLTERVAADKVIVVSNGLDLHRVLPHRPRRTPRKVVVVANLRREKGHDVLIDAAVDVLARVPDATFELVGDGGERDKLVARARARGVLHAFTLLGHRDDVAERLADADIFVLPSRSEALPNAVIEAMEAGLPIVASAVGGILELIDDGRTGLLAAPGDARALGDRIGQLMLDPVLARRLGAAACESARARYSFERMVSAFERVYLNQLLRRGIVPAAEQRGLAAS